MCKNKTKGICNARYRINLKRTRNKDKKQSQPILKKIRYEQIVEKIEYYKDKGHTSYKNSFKHLRVAVYTEEFLSGDSKQC